MRESLTFHGGKIRLTQGIFTYAIASVMTLAPLVP